VIESGVEEFVRPKGSSNHMSWVLSYADIMTNILAFFVLLLAMSHVSASRYEELASAFGNRPIQNLEEVQRDLQGLANDLGVQQEVRVERTDGGLFIELENSILFESGQAELSQQSLSLLESIGRRLAAMLEDRYAVVVEGYTDDVPIHNSRFRSNWELSTSRAIFVMEELVGAGVPQNLISVQGFADTRARARNAAGEEIESARASDRRVVLRVAEARPVGEE
jgi:chemotaxis protein MotB